MRPFAGDLALAFFKKESFEVHCFRENRWVIETSIPNQQEAEAFARKQLERKDVGGVKVIRESSGRSGGTSEAVVFTKMKEKREEKLSIQQVDSAPLCQTAADCVGLNARMTLNRMFRQYLDKQNLTPIEIMHNYREIKRVQDSDSLMTSAVGQLATLQAAGGANGTVIQRRDALYGFLGELTKRAKEVENLQLPSIKQLGVDETLAKIAPRAGDDPGNVEYLFRVAVSRELIDIRSYLGKLDRALMWVEDSQDDEAARRLDDFVCDVIGTSSVIQDLLGDQPSLMAAVTKLLDLAMGKWEAPPPGANAEAAPGGEEIGKSVV